MFFKNEIKKILKLNDVLRIVMPEKTIKEVYPSCYFIFTKTGLTNLNSNLDNLNQKLKDLINDKKPNLIEHVVRINKSTHINLVLNRNEFLKNTLNHFKNGVDNYSDFFGHPVDKKKVLIEFSSPNIAKKLHFGNFRSTLVGHCLSNLFEYKGFNLERINYYGDWGTQFGVLSTAYEKYGNENELKSNPIKHLIDIYVKGNKEADSNAEFYEESKKRFALLENGGNDNEANKVRKHWELFRELSLKEYEKDYDRLGIKFDTIQFESMFNEKAKNLIKQDTSNPNLVFKDDGSICFKLDKNKEEVLIKSDGSSLYLTRDLAAAIERKKQFDFDICYYVVDNNQRSHFKKLKTILKKMNYDWTNQLVHIPFGRINKMSTRAGTARLFDEVLEIAEQLSSESTKENKNSKITYEELENTKFDLALACLIVNLFKHKRTTDLDFDMKQFTNQSHDSGISLLYCYSRLCNLKLNSCMDFDLNCEIDYDALEGNESYYLLLLLSKFDEVIEQSCFLIEPRTLLDYLFELRTAINRAYKAYPVKGQSKSCGQTRLLLFHCAQQVYRRALRLTGIKPLSKI